MSLGASERASGSRTSSGRAPDIDAILEEPARRFYDNLASAAQRQRLDQIILGLRSDSSIDGITKFAFHVGVPDPDAVIYLDDEFRILYRLANAWTISIINIGFDGLPPRPLIQR